MIRSFSCNGNFQTPLELWSRSGSFAEDSVASLVGRPREERILSRIVDHTSVFPKIGGVKLGEDRLATLSMGRFCCLLARTRTSPSPRLRCRVVAL